EEIREELKMTEPAIKQGMAELEKINNDPETRRLYEIFEKGERDYLSGMAGAREEGIEIGEKRGATKKQREIVLNMLKSGLSTVLIQQITGLSQNEIEQLAKE
ncbi:MAG: transposase, partial [Desulfotomaculum sp.]|nr:transposase [Desulfotomaculum sp.]